MTFSQFWDALKKRNPKLGDDTAKIEITVEQFHKALRQAYEQGEKSTSGKAAVPVGGIFADFFGDKK